MSEPIRYVGHTITLITVASIQSYVFRSNRLKENAGASRLVIQAFEWWRERRRNHAGHVIYIGGGGAALRFQDSPTAVKAVCTWSRWLLEEAPGLRVVVAHRTIGEPGAAVAFEEAQLELRKAEESAPIGWDLGALPLVRECSSTGLGANGQDDDRSWISDEARRKREAGEVARRELKKDYVRFLGDWYQFPKEFRHLGQRKGASQIAIVHADGDDFGKLFSRIIEDRWEDDQAFFVRVGALSEAIKRLAVEAFGQTIRQTVDSLSDLQEQGIYACMSEEDDQAPYLPLRPIVEGGDDLTFVCHGKLGLSLARIYVTKFYELAPAYLKDFLKEGEHPSSSAGVVIMPEKFPFARGYRLAEELVREAKKRRALAGRELPWLDFQVILEGSAGDLRTTRETLYQGEDSQPLYDRPLAVGAGRGEGWELFETLWNRFRGWPRSRAKLLMEELSKGKTSVGILRNQFEAYDPDMQIPETEELRWDALEMLDFHIAWPPERTDTHAGTQN